jgi:anti-sigma factor RsiW
MNCETARTLMESNDPDLEVHLRTCLSCLIGANAPYYEAPPDLEQRIRQSLRRENAVPLPPWRWLAMVASILLVASVAGNIALVRWRVDPQQVVAVDVLSAHVRSLAGTHLLDVPSSDHHTVKPWFNGKLDFSPPVKDLAAFPLLGGRLDYFDGHPVAALIYGRNKHIINLFIWPFATRPAQAAITRNGYHMESWSGGGMAFWAVSDLNEAELSQFVSLYRQN